MCHGTHGACYEIILWSSHVCECDSWDRFTFRVRVHWFSPPAQLYCKEHKGEKSSWRSFAVAGEAQCWNTETPQGTRSFCWRMRLVVLFQIHKGGTRCNAVICKERSLQFGTSKLFWAECIFKKQTRGVSLCLTFKFKRKFAVHGEGCERFDDPKLKMTIRQARLLINATSIRFQSTKQNGSWCAVKRGLKCEEEEVQFLHYITHCNFFLLL